MGTFPYKKNKSHSTFLCWFKSSLKQVGPCTHKYTHTHVRICVSVKYDDSIISCCVHSGLTVSCLFSQFKKKMTFEFLFTFFSLSLWLWHTLAVVLLCVDYWLIVDCKNIEGVRMIWIESYSFSKFMMMWWYIYIYICVLFWCLCIFCLLRFIFIFFIIRFGWNLFSRLSNQIIKKSPSLHPMRTKM